MKKKNTLVSLLAIPIMFITLFLSGCRIPDSLNPPYQKPIEFSFIDEDGKKKTLYSYYHRYAEAHTGSQVIEVKGKAIESKRYVGTGLIEFPEADYFNGKPISSYSLEEQAIINNDYRTYLEQAQSYQQEIINNKRIPIREKIQKEAARRVKEELRNN